MIKYVEPVHRKEAFTCPHCSVYTTHAWADLATYAISDERAGAHTGWSSISQSTCFHCTDRTYWLDDWMLYPTSGTVPMPSPDLPEPCKEDYLEARDVLMRSPRGAAALLRLVIQKLCGELGESGKNINDDIGALVKKGRINVRTQRALDIVRVVGNDAVHPGVIDLRDDPALANALFGLVNQIVLEAISTDREIDAIFEHLPKAKLEGIENRDSYLNQPSDMS